MGKMKKEDLPPKKKPTSAYEMLLQNVGIDVFEGIEYPSYDTTFYDQSITEEIERQRWSRVRDILGRLDEGLIGIEEKRRNKDFYQKTVEDEDGYYRTYNFVKDLTTGEETKLSLVRDVDAVKIEDVAKGIAPDPRKNEQLKKMILGKMFEDTDPLTGKFYKGIGANIYEQSIMNSIPVALMTLGARASGDETFNKYPGADLFVNKLDVKEEGIFYDNVKLELPPEAQSIFYEWFGKKVTAEDSGVFDTFASAMVGEVMNLPFYVLAGGLVGKVAGAVAPAVMKSTSYLVKIPRAQALTFATLTTASVPRTVVHTLNGGIDAFLDDIRHTAEFSLMAGVFHPAGEAVGLGVSKLFGRAKVTNYNTLADILRKNPQITSSITGGFASAALGYAVGGEDFEDRVANALTLAALHFATPSAWKQFAKSKDKNIMVERDDYDNLVLALRQGKTLNDALRDLKVTEPRYYLREGDTLHRIAGDKFVNFGIIEKTGETLDYKSDPENFQYITQTLPFYRKLYKDALKDYRISIIADKIESEGFKNVKNPYPVGTEEYFIYEYNKRNTAEKLAAIHYGKELYKAIKKNEFPDIPGLNEVLKVSAEGLALPERVYRQMMADIFPAYMKNPEAFIARLKSEGGSLSFLPEEYRRSFESALPEIEKQIKRWLNYLTATKLGKVRRTRQAQSYIKVTDELVREFKEAKTLADYNKALEKIGYSQRVLEEVRERIKAETLTSQELDEFIAKHAEELKNDELNYNGGIGILRNNYRHWQVLSSLIDPGTIRKIGETGAIPAELKELLDKYDLEISKDPDFFDAPKSETSEEETVKVSIEKKPIVPAKLAKSRFPEGEGVYLEAIPLDQATKVINNVAYIYDREKSVDVEVTLLGEALNSKGEPYYRHAKAYVVEFPDGRIGIVKANYLSPGSKYHYLERGHLREKEGVNPLPVITELERVRDRLTMDEIVVKGHTRKGRVVNLLGLDDQKAKQFNRTFRKEGGEEKVNSFIRELSHASSDRVYELIQNNTYSYKEVLESVLSLYRRIISDEELSQEYRDFIKYELERLEPLAKVLINLEGLRVAFEDGGYYLGSYPHMSLFPGNPPSKIPKYRVSGHIIMMENKLRKVKIYGLLDTVIHEGIHALDINTSPVSPFYAIKAPIGGDLVYAEFPSLSNEYGYYNEHLGDLGRLLWQRFQVLKQRTNVPVETGALEFMLNYAYNYENPEPTFPEMFTIILTEKRVATLAAVTPYPGVRKGYTVLNAAVDQMKKVIYDYLRSQGIPEDKIPDRETYTILDEMASLLDNWLKLNGAIDLSTNTFRPGVLFRDLLHYYAEGAARVDGLLNPFEQTLKATEQSYRQALEELGITEEESLVGENWAQVVQRKIEELVESPSGVTKMERMRALSPSLRGGVEWLSKPTEIRTQTPITGKTGATPTNISGGENPAVEGETFRLGARNLEETPKVVSQFSFSTKNLEEKPSIQIEASKSFEQDNVKNEHSASVRPIPKEKDLPSMEQVREERLSKELESVNTLPLKKRKSETPFFPSLKEFTNKVIERNKFDLPRANKLLKDYFYQTIVPVYRKDFAPRFREEVYKYGEEMIRYAPYYFNTIVKRIDGWAGGMAWRRFAKPDPKTFEATTPDAVQFLQAFKDYEYARYKNILSKELTWDEFADWAKFNTEQRKMLDIYRKTLDAGIEVMKRLKTRYLTELEPKLVEKHLSEKQAQELATKYNVDVKDLDDYLNNNPELKKEIAKKIIDNAYEDWGKTVYYNSVRPVTPYTIILEFSKPTGEVDKNGQPILDRVRTYTESMAEAEAMVKDMISKGWAKEEMYEVRRIIKQPDQWGKLKSEQLLKLAEEGHIPYNDAVLRALLDVTKKGVDIHSIKKDYIPGMKYTAKEFENQLVDFLREAVYGSYKAYTLTKINDNLTKWQAEINDLSKGLSNIKSKGIDDKVLNDLQAELLYARGYYNQLRAPEKSVIDKLRGLTFSYLIGGVKPSFLFMQSVQSLQTGLHLAYKELGDFPQASRLLSEATGESMNYAFMLHALKKGQKLTGYVYDKELLDFMFKAERMGKLKAVGISEMTGVEVEPDFYYSPMSQKLTEGYIRLNNILGAGVERFTRIQALNLFWKVGKSKGLEGQALEDFALDYLDKSMTEFGKGGRAPLFESKSAIPNQGTLVTALKKSFLSLKTFSFYNYSLYYSLLKEKAWGALASKALIGMGMHGIKNFPLMAGLFMIAGLFTDNDIDYEAMKLADTLDSKLPIKLGTFLDKGLASALGTGIDFSNTFAEDSPLLTDMFASTYSPTWEGKLLELTLGAPLGYSKNIIMGGNEVLSLLKDLSMDEILTKEEIQHRRSIMIKVAPLWIKNILSAMNYERDGVEVRGRKIIAREDLTGWDIFLKALSFPVERINRAYAEAKFGIDVQIRREQQIISEAKQYIREMRTSKKMPLRAKLKEIKKAEEAMKEAKKKIIKLEQEKRKGQQ